MTRATKYLVVAGAIAVIGCGVGAAAVAATGGDDNEQPITGAELEQATRAALTYVGEGTVTETEVGDEESYYEVEVTLDDGSQVDVQLDRELKVVGSSADHEDDSEADDS